VKISSKQSGAENRLYKNAKAGFTLIELLVFLWILIFAVIGSSIGKAFASQYGPWWSILGAVIGFLAGIIVAFALFALFILILDLIIKFGAWWRPNPPVCENGCCHSYDYESTDTPLSARKHVEGISRHAYRCKCGNLYTKLGYMSLKTQWVRILSDNTVQPLLKHCVFGRWKPDTSDKIEIPVGNNEKQWEVELYTTKNLTQNQQGIFISIIVPAILFIAFTLMIGLLKSSSGNKTALVSTTSEFLLFFFVLPLMIGIGISIAIFLDKSIVQSIEADTDCIRIQRFNKQQVIIQWSQIISVKHKKDMNCTLWIVNTPNEKVSMKSEGFLQKDWQLLSDYIRKHIPENCKLKES